jgi:hypothetical protein
MKILIAGDSFSSIALSKNHGWPFLLSQKHQTTNISQPGVGEYKIMRALESQDLGQFDTIIINHTSPNRVHCVTNFLYPKNHVYRHSDLIFTDAESKLAESDLAKMAYNYFVNIFDLDYYEFIHRSCCEKIDQLTKSCQVIHMTHFEWEHFYPFDDLLNFYQLWIKNKGNYNHYTIEANQQILKAVSERL